MSSLQPRPNRDLHSSCFAMVQQLLREAEKPSATRVSPQEQEQWGQLLSNRYKLQLYKQKIRADIAEGVAQSHLKFLLFLLEQIQKTRVAVCYESEGLQLDFTSAVVAEQQRTIASLEAQKEQKERELIEASHEYEKILDNFNGVIEHLVHKQKQTPTHDHS